MSSIAVVFGSTGVAGSELVRECLRDDRVVEVRAFCRRPLGVSHSKLREVRLSDFGDLDSAAEALTGADAAFYCLGTSSRKATEREYRRVTVEYALVAARLLLDQSPGHSFHYLSGQGADPVGTSWMPWARVKGEAERSLRLLEGDRLFVYRPGYLQPEPERPLPGPVGAVGRALFPFMERYLARSALRTSELARAMIEVATSGAPERTFENARIRELGRR